MYGKIFEDIFCSTLMDHGGDTAYVFMAMIVLSDEHGVIKHTAESLARMICKDAEIVKSAVHNLEQPDTTSNLKAYGGRRIVPLSELQDDETRGWLVVNKPIYRDRASKDDKRKADRDRIAGKRSQISDVATRRKVSQVVADVAYTDTDTDTDTTPLPPTASFDAFWLAYPKKVAKHAALKAWKRIKPSAAMVEKIMAALAAAKQSEGWTKEFGRFVPYPATWLNGERWTDELGAGEQVKKTVAL